MLVWALADVGALAAGAEPLEEAEGACVASVLADEGLTVGDDMLVGEMVGNDAPPFVMDGPSVLGAGADVLIELDGAFVEASGDTVGGDVPLTDADSILEVGLFDAAEEALLIETSFAVVGFGTSLLTIGLEAGATGVPRPVGTRDVGTTEVVVPAGIANVGAAAAAAIKTTDEVFILKRGDRRALLDDSER